MNRSELKSQYKSTVRQAGVYIVAHDASHHMLLGSSMDLNGIFNRHRFNLAHGGHENKALMKAWLEFGAEQFVFEVVDTLKPKKEPGYDGREDLASLLKMWREEYRSQGWSFY